MLADPTEHNRNLRLYVKGMRQVARELAIPFIDVYDATARLGSGPDSITSNGIHLNEKGYRLVSQFMAAALDLPVQSWTGDAHSELLRQAIATKNQHFFYRSKAQNGEYIYGRRREWAGGQIGRASCR